MKALMILPAATLLLCTFAGRAAAQACPKKCTEDAEKICSGSLPTGATLIFEWENAKPGTGAWYLDPDTQVYICATCTPCEANLEFYFAPGPNNIKACLSLNEGAWMDMTPNVERNNLDKTNCGEVPDEFKVSISDASSSCGSAPIYTCTATLDCGTCQ